MDFIWTDAWFYVLEIFIATAIVFHCVGLVFMVYVFLKLRGKSISLK